MELAQELCKYCGRNRADLEIYENCPCNNMSETDKEFVVVVNGQRASGLLTEDEAKKKAATIQPTQESEKGCQPKVEVKQNICG